MLVFLEGRAARKDKQAILGNGRLPILRIGAWACLITVILFAAFCRVPSDSAAGKKSNPEFEKLKVNLENIRRTIAHLEGLGNRTSWEKQWEAAKWLLGEFKREGLGTAIEEYMFGGQRWPNVIAEMPGNGVNQEVIMLISHLDSKAYDSPELAPGADDNASGVAVILEVARLSKVRNPERTMKFCVFSNEERGRAGSKAYVRSLKEKDKLKAVINLDILGYSRPFFALQLGPVWDIGDLRGKARAVYRMSKNCLHSFFNPRQTVMVAGRPANGSLANLVTNALEDFSELKVRTVVGDDCG